MEPNIGFYQRLVIALAAWQNISDWLRVGTPTNNTATATGNPFAGLAFNLSGARFDGLTSPHGHLLEMKAYFSRSSRDDDIEMIFGSDRPDGEHYNRILSDNAISGWELLADQQAAYTGAKCYVRRFRFGVEPVDFVTVELMLVYVPVEAKTVASVPDREGWSWIGANEG